MAGGILLRSIWQETTTPPQGRRLCGTVKADVAVIGAGLVGILLADRLQAAGKTVAVVEAGEIGGGQSGRTTAKVTAQNGLCYQKLIQKQGEERARAIAQSRQRAVREYAAMIEQRQLPVDWETCRSYLYTAGDPAPLREECAAAQKLEFAATFTKVTDLPIRVSGAVYFERQGRLHPLKLLYALAENLTVYTHAPVLQVEEKRVVTRDGAVEAPYIVFASHFPFVNFPGMYFARMHQERASVLTLSDVKKLPRDVYYGVDENGVSLRPVGDRLLFCGAGYRTGTASDSFAKLEKQAKAWFPEARITGRFSAQDCVPARGLPYIGRFCADRLNWFVATGFNKWGLTGAMIAAMQLGDMLCDRESPLEELYAPDVLSARELPQILADGARAVGGIAAYVLPKSSKKAAALKRGHGAVIGRTTGAFRDADGALHTVSLRCPHLGCRLHFNKEEKTWECPCHGSRFDYRGRCIDGPAQTDIQK